MELGFSKLFRTIKIGNDSTGAISLVTNHSYSARTKHLQIRKFYMTELIESGRIAVYHVPSGELPADLFTKSTTKGVHSKLVKKIKSYGG